MIYDYKGKQKVNWIALTSRSGATLSEIVNQSYLVPETIVSAKTRKEHNMTMNWLRAMHKTNLDLGRDNNTIITLNGYMWIIPPDVCEMYEIYNLHPGPIHIKGKEWLKGKDPIERSFVPENVAVSDHVSYPGNEHWPDLYTQGSVIHRVTAGVDDGPIILSHTFLAADINNAYEMSFKVNVKLWLKFINNRKWEYGVFCE